MALDRIRLERAGGVEIDDDHLAEIEEQFAIYQSRNAVEQPLPPPFWQPDDIIPTAQFEVQARGALIEAIYSIWRECGGGEYGLRWDEYKIEDGKFIEFVLELYAQMKIPARDTPSPRTIRRDLQKDRELAANPEDEATALQRWAPWFAEWFRRKP